jgi:hypothetical protein
LQKKKRPTASNHAAIGPFRPLGRYVLIGITATNKRVAGALLWAACLDPPNSSIQWITPQREISGYFKDWFEICTMLRLRNFRSSFLARISGKDPFSPDRQVCLS